MTVCVKTADVLAASFVSPPYTAVIEWRRSQMAIAKVATPEPFSVPVPRVVAPSLNVTVPVGVPTPGATTLTVAVNVTDWPKSDGLTLEIKAVVVESRFTT